MTDRWVPETIDEAARMIGAAYSERQRIRIVGSGSALDMGHPVDHDMVLSTEALTELEVWEPDDLTAVVQAGMPIKNLEATLGEGGQSAVLTESEGTVGGIVATGRSGWRRLRYGPTRDRMLEVTLVTGDGRVVTGGGRLVKNVTGYDLPRLATGSLGSIGLIARVCVKLWPIPEASATVRVKSAAVVDGATHRPLAVLEAPGGVDVFLEGTAQAVDEQTTALGGDRRDGHRWPDRPRGEVEGSLRIRPSDVAAAVDQLPSAWAYIAQHGVGEIALASENSKGMATVRAWAEARGGALVITSGRDEIDPWGTPPTGLDIQRRLIGEFDPARLLNPGILPGGL